MSRIGKKAITVPQGVDVKIDGKVVSVKGPVGELSLVCRDEVSVAYEKGKGITVSSSVESRGASAMWGLHRALIANMVEGVSKGFSKRLIIEGTGFSAKMEKKEGKEFLVLDVGYAHPVRMEVLKGLVVKTPSSQIIEVSGADKQKVGQFAAQVRKVRPPNVYTGKGIRYDGEIVRRKAGKTLVSSGGAGG
ncbi:MAG: 50S ribosomal protein L6 [Planctomycetota bacterium]|nr:50S ribosomal protein L6 [Planctomycetota bacterium]